jgi:hypothetical protein
MEHGADETRVRVWIAPISVWTQDFRKGVGDCNPLRAIHGQFGVPYRGPDRSAFFQTQVTQDDIQQGHFEGKWRGQK